MESVSSPWNALSDELVVQIAESLDWRSRAYCVGVCRRWNRVFADDRLWQSLYVALHQISACQTCSDLQQPHFFCLMGWNPGAGFYVRSVCFLNIQWHILNAIALGGPQQVMDKLSRQPPIKPAIVIDGLVALLYTSPLTDQPIEQFIVSILHTSDWKREDQETKRLFLKHEKLLSRLLLRANEWDACLELAKLSHGKNKGGDYCIALCQIGVRQNRPIDDWISFWWAVACLNGLETVGRLAMDLCRTPTLRGNAKDVKQVLLRVPSRFHLPVIEQILKDELGVDQLEDSVDNPPNVRSVYWLIDRSALQPATQRHLYSLWRAALQAELGSSGAEPPQKKRK